MLFPYLSLVLLLHHTTATSTPPTESYQENLRITPLVDGKVHSEFQFIMKSSPSSASASEGQFAQQDDEIQEDDDHRQGERIGKNAISHHHTHLPPHLISILTHFSIASFHLTLSSGRYSPAYPPPRESTFSSAPSGIQLYAYLALLEDESAIDEAKRWEGFRGAIGGLFCAGLGSNVRGSAGSGGGGEGERPEWNFAIERGLQEAEHRLYHLFLPRLSATCTESLTPFLALLPCSSHAGLSSLLNPHRLFDGDYTLLGAHYSIVRGEAEVRLVVGSVGDPIRSDRLRAGLGRRDFSMMELYDRQLAVACPVASTSSIELVVPTNSMSAFVIEPDNGVMREEGVLFWNTSVHPTTPLDITIRWPSEAQFVYPDLSKIPLSPLSVSRLLTGHGQERGSIGIEVTNHLDVVAEVIWLEVWPWWIRGYISTLTGSIINGNTSETATPLLTALQYTPPRSRRRPTTIQALLTLPPGTTTQFVLEYESAYLWYTEYPPDAERGLEIPGAALSLLPPPSAASLAAVASNTTLATAAAKDLLKQRGGIPTYRVYSTSSILSAPVPDFSMPYNVIILTSTLLALFFGSVMNGLVREWSVVDVEDDDDETEKEKEDEQELGVEETAEVEETEEEEARGEKRRRLVVE